MSMTSDTTAAVTIYAERRITAGGRRTACIRWKVTECCVGLARPETSSHFATHFTARRQDDRHVRQVPVSTFPTFQYVSCCLIPGTWYDTIKVAVASSQAKRQTLKEKSCTSEWRAKAASYSSRQQQQLTGTWYNHTLSTIACPPGAFTAAISNGGSLVLQSQNLLRAAAVFIIQRRAGTERSNSCGTVASSTGTSA